MTRARMAAALLALGGLFMAIYLYLYKIGLIGTMACGTGACETVQLSPQSRFLGVEVSLIGVFGYAAMFLTALLALQPKFAGPAWPSKLLFVLSGGALLFTAYLTYLELFVIHAVCRWCVASALIVVALFGLSFADLRQAVRPSA
ncbi:MAG: vitamin K epoxide reductase family protein [Gemmatimonadales bacterium]|nr:vitamin K epoxide reductase family protein [Gemmatimonadales bacterium]